MNQSRKSADQAGLRYVSDASPGLHRITRGKGFAYVDARDKPVTNPAILTRIHSLVIPPAWTDVWICPSPNGHLQATGRDARGRKQSRYHPKWREVRDHDKYNHLIEFAHSLPVIRRMVRRQLRLPHMPREKVLAAIVMLLEQTCFRIGNDRYAKDNDHFGLTTFRDKHVRVNGSTMRFQFVGKSGKARDCSISDKALADIVGKCQDLPGQELFAYRDEDGKVCDIKSDHVNDYLEQIAGADVTAKDFRTWIGTVLAARALKELGAFTSKRQAEKSIVSAVDQVAEQLGNTRAVCRKCYIHPAIFDTYFAGKFAASSPRFRSIKGLNKEESGVLAMLQAATKRSKV